MLRLVLLHRVMMPILRCLLKQSLPSGQEIQSIHASRFLPATHQQKRWRYLAIVEVLIHHGLAVIQNIALLRLLLVDGRLVSTASLYLISIAPLHTRTLLLADSPQVVDQVHAMPVTIIDDFDSFIAVKNNWNSVYSQDRYAHFFLSWEWLSGWLEMIYEPWLILAFSPADSDDYAAFLPLKFTLEGEDGEQLRCELCMAGNSMADYTGLLCLPGHEQEAVSAFSQHILEQLTWSAFSLGNMLQTDPRMALLLKLFPSSDYSLMQIRTRNEGEETNQDVAPYTLLNDTWEDYLACQVSSNTRQKIRRFLRKVDASDRFHIAETTADNLETHIDILLDFWQSRWREHKGEDCNVIMDYVREIIIHCFEYDCLHLPVLWQGERPLGAIANFLDTRKQVVLFVITGRDRTVKTPPPGLVLHAYAIRHAIRHGFKVYDFLRGDEHYKYSFGAKERYLRHITVKSKQAQPHDLDARAVPLALKMAIEKHQANQLDGAEQAYRYILSAQPEHCDAMYGLGALLSQQQDYAAAEDCFKTLLGQQPESIRALFALGNLYQAQQQYSESIEAYRRALDLQPNLPPVYNNLGYAYQQQGAWEKAIACYSQALELHPDCAEAETNRANALRHTAAKQR